MPRLPDVPGDFAGATSDSIYDAAGTLFFTAYADGIQRVYKVVDGAAVPVPLEHDATARGGVFSPQLWGPHRGMYITPWDDQATAHWRLEVPGFVLPPDAPAVVVGGGYVAAPGGVVRLFKATEPFEGQHTIHLDEYGIPRDISGLEIQIAVYASAANRHARCGPTASTGSGLSVATPAPNVWAYGTRVVAPGADHTLIVQADKGAVGQLYLDAGGWWE